MYGLVYDGGTYRDWQFYQYQNTIDDDYIGPLQCDICGCAIDEGDEFFLHGGTFTSKYTCAGCISVEMEENDISREKAIESLIAYSKCKK